MPPRQFPNRLNRVQWGAGLLHVWCAVSGKSFRTKLQRIVFRSRSTMCMTKGRCQGRKSLVRSVTPAMEGPCCHRNPLMPDLRIGISGWTYAPWRGTFYPKDLPQKRELEYASRQLNPIEINDSSHPPQAP